MQTETDVLIIGAGQAGLAAAYFLKQKQTRFLMIGKESRIGDSWRSRYDSLVLFTPRAYSSLPGLALEGEPQGYAGKDEIADYLERYAREMNIPVQLHTEAYALRKEHGVFKVQTNAGELTARKVIVASGPFQKPNVPAFSRSLSGELRQLHTSAYVNPASLQEGPALIVGAGNSGAQIAVELSRERKVYLSAGHKLAFFPLEVWGKSVFWWLDRLGILSVQANSLVGRIMRRRGDPIFGSELKSSVQRGQIILKGRTIQADQRALVFEDGSQAEVRNVIWATGFRTDYSWIHMPQLFGSQGELLHHGGAAVEEGLFFLGIPWQRARGSALIGGVGKDAKYIVDLLQLI